VRLYRGPKSSLSFVSGLPSRRSLSQCVLGPTHSIGHEIAHFLRHRDRVKNRLVDDRMYRSGHGKTVEDEADALAADLLTPRRIIARFRVAGLNNVEELAAKFDVSVPA